MSDQPRENEEEQQEEKNSGRKATQTQLMLRIVVGGYLYYLVYQLLTGGVLQYTGWRLAVMVAAILLFAGFGGYFLVTSVLALVRHDYFDPNG